MFSLVHTNDGVVCLSRVMPLISLIEVPVAGRHHTVRSVLESGAFSRGSHGGP